MNSESSRFRWFAGSIALASAAACGGGGGGGGGNGSSTKVELLVGDASVNDLSSFELTLTGRFLTDDAVVESDNLLPSARAVDLLQLATQSSLLEIHSIRPGTYSSARFVFDDGSIVARDLNGGLVIVTALNSGASADFPA
ncbi:MAG: hypothetical protein EXS13_01315 [Planctomycetes bacterium]|nr:hypothetical protein [Planctomycetota bacterium]